MTSPALQRGGIKNFYSFFWGFSPAFWQHSGLKPRSVLFGYSLPRAEARGYSIHNPCNLCCAHVNTYSEGVLLHQNSVALKGLQAAGKDKHPEI